MPEFSTQGENRIQEIFLDLKNGSGGACLLLGRILVETPFGDRRHLFPDEIKGKALPQQVIVEFFGVFAGCGFSFQTDAFCDRRIYQLAFRHFFESRSHR